jgi:hypothetical protein
MNKLEKAISKEKKIEFWIGVLFLVPAILGTLSFMLCLCFQPDWSDFGGDFARMSSLEGIWEDQYNSDGGCAASPAPLFMGLMAIAGAYLIKDSLRYFFIDEGKTVLPESEKTQTSGV